MEKELALAFEFKNAPDELKEAAQLHKDNWLRVEKAKAQIEKWKSELFRAEIEFGKSGKAFRKGINEWDPAGKKSSDLVEIKEEKAAKEKEK